MEETRNSIHVDTNQLTLRLHDFARNENGINITRVHGEHHAAISIIYRHYVDLICSEQNDVRILARCEAANLVINAIIFRAFDRRKLDNLTNGEQWR